MYSSTVITINVQKQPMQVCIAGSDTCMTTAGSCMYIHTYVVSLKMHRMDIAECLHYSGPMMKQCHKYLHIIRFTPQPSAYTCSQQNHNIHSYMHGPWIRRLLNCIVCVCCYANNNEPQLQKHGWAMCVYAGSSLLKIVH